LPARSRAHLPPRRPGPSARRRAVILGLAGLAGWLLALGAAPAAAQPYTKWYLSEGATGRDAAFLEEILIGNPGTTDAQIHITFLPKEGSTVERTLTVRATSRATVRVNDILPQAEVSAVVESTNGVPIVVERSMYWPASTRGSGHNSGGVTAPAARWILAEGSTGFFQTFVLIANPDPVRQAKVSVTFLRPGGGTVPYDPNPSTPAVEEVTLGPNSRYNIWVNAEVPALATSAFSTVVESTNGVEVIAERAMYWPAPGFASGHESAGVTAPARTWLFAEGVTTRRDDLNFEFQTFLLLANPNATPTRVRVTFFVPGGVPPVEKAFDLAAFARRNLWVNVEVPELAAASATEFSMKVESIDMLDGRPSQPIVAERAVYWGPPGNVPNWPDGHDTPGVTAEALAWAFAEGLEDGFADARGLNFDSYFLIGNTSSTPLELRATFFREDGTGIVREFRGAAAIPAASRFTLAGFWYPELSNQRFAAFFESLNGVPFIAERAVYWGAGYSGGHASTGTPWTGPIATPPAPPLHTVTRITPESGPTAGGTVVTIEGTNFAAGATVSIGGVPATGVLVLDASTIRATTGAAPSITTDTVVDVTVRSNGVERTLGAAFTYIAPKPPTVTDLSPASGPSTGGTEVTLTGTDFMAGATVAFGGTPASSVVVESATRIRAVAPPRIVPAGVTSIEVTVTVTTNQGQASAPRPFRYDAVTVTEHVVAFGDSITYGVTNCGFDLQTFSRQCYFPDPLSERGYPLELENRMKARYPTQSAQIIVDNQGAAGEFTDQGVARLPGTLQAPQDLVIILEGANDIMAGDDETCAVSIGTIATNLQTMVQTALDRNKKVILSTLTPITDDFWNTCGGVSVSARVSALNGAIRALADRPEWAGRVFLADLFAAVNEDPAQYLSGDGLHPSPAGYARMAEYLADLIRRKFEGVVQ
jgi:lysophospholipase L1-like esterase